MKDGRRLVSRAILAGTLGMSLLVLGVPAAQAAAPTITSFNPTSGVIGTSVQINGTGFQDTSVVSAVTFNGTAATSFTVNSDVLITATVPLGATDGPIAVTDTEGTATSATNFDVTPSPVPTITSFNPTSGPVGTVVVITGTGFTGATAVTFGGIAATTFTVDSNTQITATVPAGATTGPIAVTTPGGTATSATNFTVGSPVPTITSFNPTSGPVGTVVVITGTGFTGATAVTFGGIAATTFTVDSNTQITATVPAGAVDGPIAVTTPGGTATSATNFDVTGGAPTVHDRSVTLDLSKHLVAKGEVNSGFDACESGVDVKIQRNKNGNWKTIANDTTSNNGSYKAQIGDNEGKYRALVPKFSPDTDNRCVKDVSPVKKHKH